MIRVRKLSSELHSDTMAAGMSVIAACCALLIHHLCRFSLLLIDLGFDSAKLWSSVLAGRVDGRITKSRENYEATLSAGLF